MQKLHIMYILPSYLHLANYSWCLCTTWILAMAIIQGQCSFHLALLGLRLQFKGSDYSWQCWNMVYSICTSLKVVIHTFKETNLLPTVQTLMRLTMLGWGPMEASVSISAIKAFTSSSLTSSVCWKQGRREGEEKWWWSLWYFYTAVCIHMYTVQVSLTGTHLKQC